MAVHEIDLGSVVAQRYRVGDIHISTDPTSPAELYGGTWERIKDVFLLAAGDEYTVGATGGASSHTHAATGRTRAAANWNDKTFYFEPVFTDPAWTGAYYIGVNEVHTSGTYTANGYIKSDVEVQSADGMPPYEVFYMWKRVS